MTRTQLRNILLFAVGLAAMMACLVKPLWGQAWLRDATYFVMFVVVGAWLVRWAEWARARWASPREMLRANLPEILLATGALALVFATHDWAFKVLSDESNMVDVARNLSTDWRFEFPGLSKFYNGVHHLSHFTFEKRPPLFMFALSLVDSLGGYRVRNVWYLNGALTWLTMVVAAGALRKRVGRPWNLLAVVWAIANPIVLQTASAAGVEPILALMWAIAGVLMLEVLEDPRSPSFPLFIATIYLVALARIEAGPMAAMMLAVVILASKDRGFLLDSGRDDWLVWAAPLVALSPVVQRLQKSYFQGSKLPPFSFRYVVENVHNWRLALFTPGSMYPFNAIVTLGELVALVALLILAFTARSKLTRAEKIAFLTFTALTASFVAMYSFYYWGQPTKASSSRFYALPFFFAGLAAPLLLRRIEALRARPIAVATFVAAVFVQAVPAASSHAFTNTLGWRRQHLIVTEYLNRRLGGEAQPGDPRGRTILLVTKFPGQFLLYDVGAVPFKSFHKDRKQLATEINHAVYDEVLFAQEIEQSTGKPTSDTAIDADLKTEVVLERQSNFGKILRLSRLVREPGKPALSPTASEPSAEDPAPPGDQEDPASASTIGPESE